ncbi:MAG: site-2 protease family protein, partial [bacterium]
MINPDLPIWIIMFMVCGGIHEFAHAWTAYKCGDSTAADQGRLTINPIAHVDPFGLLMLIASSMAGWGFGWMKPVPVSVVNLRNPRWDMVKVAAAGPVSNILQAL